MGLREFFLWQLEHEAATTRAVIKRIPEGKDKWKPAPGSMELGQLASLAASMPGMVSLLVNRRVLNLDLEICQGANLDFAQQLEAGLQRSRHALVETTEEHLLGMVRFRQNGQVVNEGPRYAMIADAAFTQQAQLRGQLTVYLNMLEAEPPRGRRNQSPFSLQTSVEVLTMPTFRQTDPGCPTSWDFLSL